MKYIQIQCLGRESVSIRIGRRSTDNPRYVGWIHWDPNTANLIKRRFQKAGIKRGDRLRWRDGFCLRVRHHYLLVSFPKRVMR